MSSLIATFKVIEEKGCPFYRIGDELDLSDNAILLPMEKAACVTLFKDLIGMIENCKEIEASDGEYEYNEASFNCGGCTGSIRLEYRKTQKDAAVNEIIKQEKVIENISRLLKKFSIFQSLDEKDIKEIVSYLRLKEYTKGEVVITKGEPGRNLFIITSGKVEVMNEDKSIAVLEKGEVFGEMSLLSGDPVSATIRTVEATKVLHLNQKDSRKILIRFPNLKLYLARLITLRRKDEAASTVTPV